jgi:hypothetical protein
VKKDFDAEALALVAAELVSKGVRGLKDDSDYADTNYVDAISIAFQLLNLTSGIASRLKELEASPQMLAMLAAKLRENTLPHSDASMKAIERAVDLWLQCKSAHAFDWETAGKHIAEINERWAKEITLNKALMRITGKRSGPAGRKRFLEKYAKNGKAAEAQRFIQEHEGKPVSVGLVELYRARFLSFRPERARSARGTIKKARAEKSV